MCKQGYSNVCLIFLNHLDHSNEFEAHSNEFHTLLFITWFLLPFECNSEFIRMNFPFLFDSFQTFEWLRTYSNAIIFSSKCFLGKYNHRDVLNCFYLFELLSLHSNISSILFNYIRMTEKTFEYLSIISIRFAYPNILPFSITFEWQRRHSNEYEFPWLPDSLLLIRIRPTSSEYVPNDLHIRMFWIVHSNVFN